MKQLSLLLMLLSFVVSCGKNQESLRVSMWVGNIPQEIYRAFEKETGIKIIEDIMTSNEEVYTKVKVNPAGYDIITPSLDFAEIMVKEGLVAQFDKAQIPNFTNIDPNILKHIKSMDPNHEYIIPFAFGPTIIAYDKTKVSNDIKGFEIFSNPTYKRKMLLLDYMPAVLGSALLLSGYELGDSSDQAMADASALITTWKQNILRFDFDSFQLAYANEEVDIVQGYVSTMIPYLSPEKLSNTVFIVPEKGGTMWLDNFVIVKNSPNKAAAMKFINFIHRPDIYARIMTQLNALSLNVPARDLITTAAPIVYEDLDRLEMTKAIDKEALIIHSRVWENLHAQ